MNTHVNFYDNRKKLILEHLRELLIQGSVSTQEEICAALESQGHDINQSKVSRLLRKIGAVKAKNEQGEVVYRLPKEPAPPAPSSQLAGLIIDIASNEALVLVNTSPGSASLIARLLDYNKDKAEILGTIAGDDTILVIPKSTHRIDHTLQSIKALLYGNQ